jgi:hypothetical protein
VKRRLLAALAVLATSAGMIAVTAAPAAAATLRCGSASYSVPDVYAEAGGQIRILGWAHATYIGSFWGYGTTYKIWHYTYQVNGGGTYYQGGAGVRCNSSNDETGVTDLTRETLTSSDHPKCGTTSYSVGSVTYTYLGSRTSEGDRFRYWGDAGSSGMMLFRYPTAVRCD